MSRSTVSRMSRLSPSQTWTKFSTTFFQPRPSSPPTGHRQPPKSTKNGFLRAFSLRISGKLLFFRICLGMSQEGLDCGYWWTSFTGILSEGVPTQVLFSRFRLVFNNCLTFNTPRHPWCEWMSANHFRNWEEKAKRQFQILLASHTDHDHKKEDSKMCLQSLLIQFWVL